MRSPNFPYNPKIDEIRLLAASIVFLFHFYWHCFVPSNGALAISDWNWLGLITEGHTGVALFFTLSGFLFMQIALHQEKIAYADFIRNRFLRIFPLFITIFFLAISIDRDQFRAQDILYLFFSNIGDAPTSKNFITGAAWTISLEFTFYLVFPFLARFAIETGPRYLLQLLVLLLLAKFAAYGVTERSTHMLYSTIVGRFDQFLIGMLAAFVYRRHHARLHRAGWWLLPLASIAVVVNGALQATYASFFSENPKQVFWITWSMQESTVWATFILAWVSTDFKKPAWLAVALRQGGQISFSFYLLHALVLYLGFRWIGYPRLIGNPLLDGLLLAVPLFATTWAVASLSYASIERPFLALRRRYGDRQIFPVQSKKHL